LSIFVIFEPSKVRLYISPFPEKMKPMIGFFAVFLGAANAAGGYIVTERMLGMFKAGGRKQGGEQ